MRWRRSGSAAFVVVVEAAEVGYLDDAGSTLRAVDGPQLRQAGRDRGQGGGRGSPVARLADIDL
jgi:hypothetical protein